MVWDNQPDFCVTFDQSGGTMRSEERSEKQNEYYFQENQQNMHNLQNMKYIDPCFQGIGLTL